MNAEEAVAQGFTVDLHAKPPVAYKGPRTEPTEIHELDNKRTASADEVCHMIGLALLEQDGKVIAEIANKILNEEVTYDGDSLFTLTPNVDSPAD